MTFQLVILREMASFLPLTSFLRMIYVSRFHIDRYLSSLNFFFNSGTVRIFILLGTISRIIVILCNFFTRKCLKFMGTCTGFWEFFQPEKSISRGAVCKNSCLMTSTSQPGVLGFGFLTLELHYGKCRISALLLELQLGLRS